MTLIWARSWLSFSHCSSHAVFPSDTLWLQWYHTWQHTCLADTGSHEYASPQLREAAGEPGPAGIPLYTQALTTAAVTQLSTPDRCQCWLLNGLKRTKDGVEIRDSCSHFTRDSAKPTVTEHSSQTLLPLWAAQHIWIHFRYSNSQENTFIDKVLSLDWAREKGANKKTKQGYCQDGLFSETTHLSGQICAQVGLVMFALLSDFFDSNAFQWAMSNSPFFADVPHCLRCLLHGAGKSSPVSLKMVSHVWTKPTSILFKTKQNWQKPGQIFYEAALLLEHHSESWHVCETLFETLKDLLMLRNFVVQENTVTTQLPYRHSLDNLKTDWSKIFCVCGWVGGGDRACCHPLIAVQSP